MPEFGKKGELMAVIRDLETDLEHRRLQAILRWGNLPDIEEMVSTCGALVTVDGASEVI